MIQTGIAIQAANYLIPLTGAGTVAALGLIAALCTRWVVRSAARRSQQLQESATHMAQQLEQLGSAIAAADARVAALAARLDEQSRTSQGSSATNYNVAIRMARSGASRQELMTTCGVTQQEADLVLRLHATGNSVRTAA